MAERQINPILKQVLELGPVVLFFAGFFLLKAETYTVFGHEMPKFILLTALFIPLTLIALGVTWILTGALSRMQVFTAVLVTVLGGASVWFNDERFIKMKPTALYLAFAGILGVGLMRNTSYLSTLMGSMVPMQNEGWMILTRRFVVLFLVFAVANEVVWRNFSDGTWLSFKLFGFTAATLVFLIAQHKVFTKYGIEEEPKA